MNIHENTALLDAFVDGELTREEMISAIESMTVLELNELVKALEEKFGFSAAAPVAVAAAPAALAVCLAASRACLAYSRLIFHFWAMRERKVLFSSGFSCTIF